VVSYQFTKDDFSSTKLHHIKKGQHVLYAGEQHRHNCFLILEGSFSICLISASGHEMLLYHLHKHQLIGEIAMFGQSTRSATATADEDCILLEISEHEFHERLQDYDFLRKITELFLQRYLKTHEVVCRLSQSNISMKICRYLKTLANQSTSKENRIRLLIPSHAELARLISCQRETVSREIKKLIKAGVITQKSGNWFYADRKKINMFLSETL